ncbi:hypothetical protein CLOM_g20615 [Closterium sp. NIES-68]|nr:hypothetical protein CLOM_g20615 [Closterium sp. NIES-68]
MRERRGRELLGGEASPSHAQRQRGGLPTERARASRASRLFIPHGAAVIGALAVLWAGNFPLLPRVGAVVPLSASTIQTLLTIKSSLGVTLTTWTATNTVCTLSNQQQLATDWTGVYCSAIGEVRYIDLEGQKLSGSIPKDISKLTLLNHIGLGTNLLAQRLDVFTSNVLPLSNLADLHIHQNWLYGTIPTALIALPKLYWIKFFRNYLTGTFPTPGPALKNMDLQHNFLSGPFPSHSATYCTATSNCFSQAATCNTTATTQRSPAACSVCGVTMTGDGTGWVVPVGGAATQVLCGGGVCAPNATVPASLGSPYVSSSPLLPMFCAVVGMDGGSSQALLALKSSLGVTLPSWVPAPTATVMGVASTSPSFPSSSSPSSAYLCPVTGALAPPLSAAAAAAGTWSGVDCNAAGAVVRINLNRQGLTGTIHSAISKLTALTHIDLGYNLVQARLSTFATPLTALTALKDLFLHYNWFMGSIPSSLLRLPALTALGLFSNYLTGTIPPIPSSLVGLDIGNNFLSGSLPPHSLQFCAAENNCLSSSTSSASSSKCNFYGTNQRPLANCAVCGIGDAAGTAGVGGGCWDGVCVADAAVPVAQGVPNGPMQPTLPMTCVGSSVVTIRSSSTSALLALKTSLGVSLTTWRTDLPCAIDGSTSSTWSGGTWSGVRCDITGNVTYLDLNYQQLRGSIHADVSKLTALTLLNLHANVFWMPLGSFTSHLSALTNLKLLQLQYNWLYGSLPSTLLALPRLTKLTLNFNFLTGTVPPVSVSLAYLSVQQNYLSGTFPSNSITYCNSLYNCFTQVGNCTSAGRDQNMGFMCSICGSVDGSGALCSGTGVCKPNVAEAVAAGAVYGPDSDLVVMYCDTI